ncbi:MAG TPA: glycosyltransferase family 39 protein [Ktedonobacterales bacterium]
MSDTERRRRLVPVPKTEVAAVTASSPGSRTEAFVAPWWLASPAVQIGALVIVGGLLRFIGITHQSLWLDESYSAFVSAHPFSTILNFTAGSDAHPPLYYLVLHVWMLFGRSALVLRTLSAVASLAAVLATYGLGRTLGNARVATFAASLMALSAFQAWYGQEVRMYALTSLAALLAVWAFVRACDTGRAIFWFGYIGAMLVALYLDYTAFFVGAGLLVWFLRHGWKRSELRLPYLASCVALFLGYLPWLPSLWRQTFVFGSLTGWVSGSNGSGLVGALTDFFFNRSNLLQPGSGTLAALAAVFSVSMVAIAFLAPRHAPAFPILAYWLGVPCVLEAVAEFLNHSLVIGRTIMVVQPALFLLLALAAESAWKRTHEGAISWPRLVPLAVLFALFVTTNLAAQSTSWSATLKEDWRSAATTVATHQRTHDLVLFNSYFAQMPFDYYYAGELQATSSTVSVDERGYQLDESLLYQNLNTPHGAMVSGPMMSSYARIWLVLSHTGGPDNQAIPPWLLKHDELLQVWHYPGISVRLYQVAGKQDTGGLLAPTP